MAWHFADELRRFGPGAAASNLAFARSYCARVARSHYENFAVASVLLPRPLLPHFHAVYAFCRWADDLADETAGGAESLRLLDWWRGELLRCYDGTPTHPVTVALRETVRRFRIPPAPFLDLISAFEQDQRVKRYETFAELRDYCTRSANPVGRVVLHLFGCADDTRLSLSLSDDICTGLQLANFWQDGARDWAIGRVYIPADVMAHFGVTEADIAAKRFTPAFAAMMRELVSEARKQFTRGAALLPLLPPTPRANVALFVDGGYAILDAIERQGFDVLTRRPVVGKWAKAKLLAKALVSFSLSGGRQPPERLMHSGG